jgi:peptidoglycan hydrolase-like protein with peptidoglycan-binding domain
MALLKRGSEGAEVRDLQVKLTKLGYEVEADGKFGPITEWAVKNLQAMFGYTIDGLVGDGTMKLVDSQIGYGWSARSEGAHRSALKAQGLLK